MDRNKIVDKVIEVCIAGILGMTVATMKGLRTDINQLNTTFAGLTVTVANHDKQFNEDIEYRREFDTRLRAVELQCAGRGNGARK